MNTNIVENLLTEWPYNMLMDIWPNDLNIVLRTDMVKFSETLSHHKVLSTEDRRILHLYYKDLCSPAVIAEAVNVLRDHSTLVKPEDIKDIVKDIRTRLKIHLIVDKVSDEMQDSEWRKKFDEYRGSVGHIFEEYVNEQEKLKRIVSMKDEMIEHTNRRMKFISEIIDSAISVEEIQTIMNSIDIRIADVPDLAKNIRMVNSLNIHGYTSLGDLAMSSKKDLMKIEWFGKNSLSAIIKVLNEYGLTIPDERF